MKGAQELRQRLESLKNGDRRVAREASRGLRYAEEFDGADKRDVLRHYLQRAREAKDRSAYGNTPDYEGNVLNQTTYNNSVTGYTIVDCTSLEADEVDAKLIDVTSIRAEQINCGVLDATSVVAGDMNAQVTNYTSFTSLEKKKEEEEKQERKRKERKESAEDNLKEIEDELEDDKEKEVAKQMLEGRDPEEQEEIKDLLTSNENPYRILRDSAARLAEGYTRPPKRSGADLVDVTGPDMTVYVSDVRPPSGAGNTMHQGEWVLVRYDNRRERIEVSYKRDGVAGNSDERETLDLEEANPDRIEKIAHKYLGGPSLF